MMVYFIFNFSFQNIIMMFRLCL
uniref:Uncharacterized protein n=1 Tax=Anguilla anguilla TaxID=7936 RepID=A0A0E9SJF4_ANGAN